MRWNQNKALVAASMGIGLISGTLRPIFLSDYSRTDLAESLYHFTTTLEAQSIGIGELFGSALRYGRSLLLIWACVALPKTHYAALLVLYMRAMSLSFSAVMMIVAFGGRGFAYAFALYGLQNIIIMPVYAYTAYFILKSRAALAVKPPENLAPTVKTAAIGLAAVAAVSAVENYISPTLFALIWR